MIIKQPDRIKLQPGKWALLALVVGSLSACAGDMSDLDRFIIETKQKHHGKVDPLPEFAEYVEFVYSATDMRDPFKASRSQDLIAKKEYTGPRPEEQREREALENFPIDSLKMVGLLQQRNQVWGLVRDPEGTIHRVQPGNYAGQNHGKIIVVNESIIDIQELVPDGEQGWIPRDAQLAMAEDE